MRSSVSTAKSGVPRYTIRSMPTAPLPLTGFGQFADFSLDQVAFERAHVGDVGRAIQMIGLVQKRARQQIFTRFFEKFAFRVLGADGHALAPRNLLPEPRDRQAPFLTRLNAFDLENLGIDQDELLLFLLAGRR